MKFKLFLLFFFIITSSVLYSQSTSKPLVESKKGMVVTTHPLATEIGLSILKEGMRLTLQ